MPNIKDSHRCVRLKGQGDLNLKIGEHLLLCGTRKKRNRVKLQRLKKKDDVEENANETEFRHSAVVCCSYLRSANAKWNNYC